MKDAIATLVFAAFALTSPATSHGGILVIDPTSDGSLYVCPGCNVVSEGDYVLVSGYIQGDLKFASNSISGTVTQALLSLNPYGLPLLGSEVAIYGFGADIGALDESDANAGVFLGTLILPANLGYGEDVYFDVTPFVAGTIAPFLAFNLRTTDTDVFSSLEYNYGHPSQLHVTTTAIAEPAPVALLFAGLVALAGISPRGRIIAVFSFHHNRSPSGQVATTRACIRDTA
jgi:hypothetical protein